MTTYYIFTAYNKESSAINGIAARPTDSAYQLESVKGCRAIYKHSSGYTRIVINTGMGNYKQYAAI